METQPVTAPSPSHVHHKVSISSRAPLRKETLHSVEVWESKRDIIRELYMDRNKPLREVSKILETQHNFIASHKQYKIRFKRWGFWKNLSTLHASSLLELKKSRESLGKPSTFVRSGQKLKQIRIERTIRRSRAKTSAKHESKQNASEMLVAVPSLPCAPEQPLPTGIECRTPSPEPQLDDSTESFLDVYRIVEPQGPQLCAHSSAGPSTPEAYSIEEAEGPQGQQETYLDKLKTSDVATRKLWRAYYCGDTPASPDQLAGLQDFKRRNTLLAILEPAINDKDRLCTTYLQNYAATFLDCPKLSQFSRQYVLPALEHGTRSAEQAALARDVDDFIQIGINLLNLSIHTTNLIENAARLDQSYLLADDVFPTQDESVINPALLNGFFDADSLLFDSLGFDIPEGPPAGSSGSSPTATTMSASGYSASPCTLFDGSSPATEAAISDVSMTAARGQADILESRFLYELDLSVSCYHSGDSASAMTGLRNVATCENLNTKRGKVLTRMAWFCLSCIHQEQGVIEQAGDCLMEAVRGSTHFRDDKGEEWHEVSHLFL